MINFTAYGSLPERSEESNTLAVLECAIYKSPELSVNWTRNGSAIPTGFKYVMAQPFQLEGGSTWVYQLTVRQLTRGDVGEYGCTVYFQGEVEGVVPVWILESGMERCDLAKTERECTNSFPSRSQLSAMCITHSWCRYTHIIG